MLQKLTKLVVFNIGKSMHLYSLKYLLKFALMSLVLGADWSGGN